MSCRGAVTLRGDAPDTQLLAIFDVLYESFANRDDFDGCAVMSTDRSGDHSPGL